MILDADHNLNDSEKLFKFFDAKFLGVNGTSLDEYIEHLFFKALGN